MPRLFISYSRTDEVFARRLATSLSQMGADIWIDIRDIPAGMKWSSAIQQGLDICDAMIVVISPASMASSNVEDEWQYYRDRNKPIVPVMIQQTQMHYQLSRLQYIGFDRQPYEIALSQLHSELWRKGILLSPPPNAVTQPVPRTSAPPAYAATPPPIAAAPRQKPRSSSRGLLSLGCVGLVVAAIVLVGGWVVLSGALGIFTPAPGVSTATETPTIAATDTLNVQAELVVMSESVRLRTGPGVVYPALDTIFGLSGERYDIIAQAPSMGGTSETWYLIDHPVGGLLWISSETVDVQPDGVYVPPAATVPALAQVTATSVPASVTPTPIATPTEAPPAVRTILQTCQVSSGTFCTAEFNSDTYRQVTVRSDATYEGASVVLTLKDANDNTLATSTGSPLVTTLETFRTYTLVINDSGGASGTIMVTIEMLP